MTELYIGLMSGTSMDAIDAVLVDFSTPPLTLLATHSADLPTSLRAELLALGDKTTRNTLERLGQLDHQLGERFADAVNALLRQADLAPAAVLAIGSHGQTVWHQPAPPHGFTLQIGDPHRIAARSGITTVADFRRRDLAHGGQGAPLVPAFHAALWRDPQEDRAVINLGGICNLTLLPAAAARPVTGFDIGPGNTLLDAWTLRNRGERYDRSGAWAASGTVQSGLLERLLADRYFRTLAPKSTGPENFNLAWLETYLTALPQPPCPADIQATLCALTAESIAHALARITPKPCRVLLCGGGVYNVELIRRITAALAPCPIDSTAIWGLAPHWVEASAFAWLAREALAGRPGNVPSVTGARRAVVLGAIYPRD